MEKKNEGGGGRGKKNDKKFFFFSVPYFGPQMGDCYGKGPNTSSNYSNQIYHPAMNLPPPEVKSMVINTCRSPFDNNNEPENSKEPLSQLQELTNVFSNVGSCERSVENCVKVRYCHGINL